MLPDRVVWFAWSCVLLLGWLGLYMPFPRVRGPLVYMSLFTLPFGLSEPLFVGNYWNPPSLFDLAARIHFDFESLAHAFCIGGTAAVLYNVVTDRPVHIPVKTTRDTRHQELHNLAVACPALVFPIVLWLSDQTMVAAIAGMSLGAAVRLVYLPSLRTKTLVGALLFVGYFILCLLVLEWIAPGYIGRTWRPRPLAMPILGPLPLSELLFAATFGAFWSGLYEQWKWTFARLPSKHPQAIRAKIT